jgi:DNA-binding CsgD family transcriptional regulator
MLFAPDAHSAAEASLSAFREVVPGDHFTMILCDLRTFATDAYFHGEGWLPAGHPYAEAARGKLFGHPVARVFFAQPGPLALARSRVASDAVWKTSALYNEVDRPHGVEDTATLCLMMPGDAALILTCGRDRHFSERDLAAAESLLRVLAGLRRFRPEKHPPGCESKSLPGTLTQREREVLRWVREGKRNAEIAAILAISPHTVHHHIEKIFAKLGVETRAAAARFAQADVE